MVVAVTKIKENKRRNGFVAQVYQIKLPLNLNLWLPAA